mmetsp:Transcript_31020/g.73749  ORF Transcript_31020/g.73749 Transcript_31020/m.73749 type:complete len:207 (-) Transcript_31020:19-639(-)
MDRPRPAAGARLPPLHGALAERRRRPHRRVGGILRHPGDAQAPRRRLGEPGPRLRTGASGEPGGKAGELGLSARAPRLRPRRRGQRPFGRPPGEAPPPQGCRDGLRHLHRPSHGLQRLHVTVPQAAAVLREPVPPLPPRPRERAEGGCSRLVSSAESHPPRRPPWRGEAHSTAPPASIRCTWHNRWRLLPPTIRGFFSSRKSRAFA